MKIFGYIYLTTNLINNKKYIGLHTVTKKSKKKYLGSGKLLKKAIKKYGKENFKKEILEYCYNLKDLQNKEIYYIKKYDATKNKNFYNLLDTKQPILFNTKNGFYGKKHSLESKQKMSKSRTNKKQSKSSKKKIGIKSKKWWDNSSNKKSMANKRRGYKHSENTKKQIGESNKGKTLSNETKKKISLAKTGKKHPMTKETKLNISIALTGKKKSLNHINKINKNPEKIKKTAEKHRGMKRTTITRKKISLSKIGKNLGKKNVMFNGYYITPLGIFETASHAAIEHELKVSNIHQRCKYLNKKTVKKDQIIKCKDLHPDMLGKTWNELGWNFEKTNKETL